MRQQGPGVRRLCLAVAAEAPDLLESVCRTGGFDRLYLPAVAARGVEVGIAPPGIDELALVQDLVAAFHRAVRGRADPGGPVLMAFHVGIIRVVGDELGGAGAVRARELVRAPDLADAVRQWAAAGQGPGLTVVVSEGLFADLRSEGLPGEGWQWLASASAWLRHFRLTV
jgi:hypothetical protein